MAVSITKSPPRVHFAGNQLPFELTTNNLYLSEGTKFFRVAFKDGAVTLGDTFRFQWGDYDITFTAVNNPDDSGTQVKAGGSNQVIVNSFNTNFNLSHDFLITAQGQEIYFEARLVGENFDLDISFSCAGYTLYGTWTPGADAVRHPFFSLIAQAQKPLDFLFGTDKITPPNDGVCVFDPTDYLLPHFDVKFQFPVSDIFILRNDSIVQYVVRVCEQYGSPIQSYKVSTSSVFYALPGKLADDSLLNQYTAGQSFWDRLPYTKQFLSGSPASKISSISSPEKLYFLVYYAYSGVAKLKISVAFTNGTSGSFWSDEFAVSKFDVIEINCGYDVLQIQNFINSSHPGKIAASWSVQIYHFTGLSSLPVSEVKSFVIDPRSYVFERFFIFQNAFGYFETLRTTGKAAVSNSVERDQHYNNKPAAFDPTHRNRFSRSYEFAESIELYSGYFQNYDTAFWAKEAFLSDNVFEVINDKIVPVVVLSDSIEIRKDSVGVFFFKIDYAYAFPGAVFPVSDETGLGDFNDDFNDDFQT